MELRVSVTVLCLLCSPAAADNGPAQPYRITAGYWNDNFLLNNLYESDTFHGADDFVTVSFWLQGLVPARHTIWRIDLYHNALTNRAANYRTDLLTFRFSGERTTAIGPVQAGIGIIANGDFGGDTVQNRYHRLIGHDQVELPYTVPEKTGPLVYLRYAPVLAEWGAARLTAYLSDAHRFEVGPSAIRAGIEITGTWQPDDGSLRLTSSLHTGHLWFYRRNGYLRPLFDRGFVWGVKGGIGSSRHMVSVWVTHNQYGRNQPHFGISYSFATGDGADAPDGMNDVLFP